MFSIALLATAAAGFPYVLVEANDEGATFYFPCKANTECYIPGQKYCGLGDVDKVECVGSARCEVTCKPADYIKTGGDCKTCIIGVAPREKTAGRPLGISVRRSGTGTPVLAEVDVYFGGKLGARETPTPLMCVNVVETTYFAGELVLSTRTDRFGNASFTPAKPGQYVIKAASKYIWFQVGDSEGKTYVCGNGFCESALGEDKNTCPRDCVERNTTPQEECVPEGGLAESGRSCCAGLTAAKIFISGQSGECKEANSAGRICIACGNGECRTAEDRCNCPADCGSRIEHTGQNQPQGNDMILLILLAIAACGAVVALLKTGKLNMSRRMQPVGGRMQTGGWPKTGYAELETGYPKPEAGYNQAMPAEPGYAAARPAEAATPKGMGRCPACGAEAPSGCAACMRCGMRL